jgi:NAD(P)-dependent dehydrogenase (short-subunit alcohol dehydrogenase family)
MLSSGSFKTMNKVIFITGTSSGFGKQIAEMLAAKGHTVYGTLRRANGNNTGTGNLINFVRLDLTDPVSINRAVETVLQKEGKIDVLINNAGMHTAGPIETSPIENIKLQMDTNFLGMVHLTRAVLPAMRKQGGGLIINFSSVGGLLGLPFQAFYSASKFAIEGFSEALRMELNQFKIKVVVINPGDFCTSNSVNRKNFLAPTGPSDPYGAQYTKTMAIYEKDEANGRSPEVLARKIVRIVESKNPKQRYLIASFLEKLSVVFRPFLPGQFYRSLIQLFYGIK